MVAAMAAGADRGAAASLLAQADAYVKELEDLEDYYFGEDKQWKMDAAAARTAELVEKALGPLRPPPKELNVQGLFLRGRALSFLPGKEGQAEELLSKAIKLDPKLLVAWNALGEVHWNTQNFQRARECFERALEFCGQNAVSLRSLSMVLRAVDSEVDASIDDAVASRRADNFTEGLEKAKAAVALDTSDPQNWETLGNAYVGDFFVNARRPDELNRALVAYAKAETAYGKLGKSNPSLQLNRGMAAKYIEDYDLALRSFRKAAEIGNVKAGKEGQKVMELVQRLASYTERKGDLKAKHLKELLEGFQGGATGRTLDDLQKNIGSAETPLMARVVNIVEREDELPMIVICCDASGNFFSLSLYNTQPSKFADAVIPMKTLIHVRLAKYRLVSVKNPHNHKSWTYPCVRVGHPGDVTIVGGASLESAAVLSKFTVAALPRKPQDEEIAPVAGGYDEAEAPLADDPVEWGNAWVKQEKWIDQEDAKIKKDEAKAKARAKAKGKAKGKKKDKTSDKVPEKKSKSSIAGNIDAEESEEEDQEESEEEEEEEPDVVEEVVEQPKGKKKDKTSDKAPEKKSKEVLQKPVAVAKVLVKPGPVMFGELDA